MLISGRTQRQRLVWDNLASTDAVTYLSVVSRGFETIKPAGETTMDMAITPWKPALAPQRFTGANGSDTTKFVCCDLTTTNH